MTGCEGIEVLPVLFSYPHNGKNKEIRSKNIGAGNLLPSMLNSPVPGPVRFIFDYSLLL
jgi:hypothetical protein